MNVREKPATQDRREQILTAAGRVIGDRGLSETRISDIAKEAGVSPALILYYFDTKDRVLLEALTHANDRFFLRMSRETRRLETAWDKLAKLVELNCQGLRPGGDSTNEWPLWMEVWTRALRDPQMRKDHDILDRRWRAAIADIIREGQKSGEFGTDDADEAALRISAMIDGLSISIVLGATDVTPRRIQKAILEMAVREVGYKD